MKGNWEKGGEETNGGRGDTREGNENH